MQLLNIVPESLLQHSNMSSMQVHSLFNNLFWLKENTYMDSNDGSASL